MNLGAFLESSVEPVKVKEPIVEKAEEKPKEVEVTIEEEPKDIRQFLRKHPKCEYDFALKYFTKKQIKDAISIGKIIKRGNTLRLG